MFPGYWRTKYDASYVKHSVQNSPNPTTSLVSIHDVQQLNRKIDTTSSHGDFEGSQVPSASNLVKQSGPS